jgi:hypothetical protein
MLPQELGCGSGMTCWRRLHDWQKAGIWGLIHFSLLDWLSRFGQIDWSRGVVDSCSVRAVFGGTQTGPNPTDRAKLGSKRHLICDGHGIPRAWQEHPLEGAYHPPFALEFNSGSRGQSYSARMVQQGPDSISPLLESGPAPAARCQPPSVPMSRKTGETGAPGNQTICLVAEPREHRAQVATRA